MRIHFKIHTINLWWRRLLLHSTQLIHWTTFPFHTPPPPTPLHIASNIIPSTHSHHICIVTTNPHPPTHPPALQCLLSSLSHLHEHLLHGGHWHSKTGIPSSALRGAWRQGERNILTCKQTPVDDHELPQKCTVHNTADCIDLANSKWEVLCTWWISNWVMVNSVVVYIQQQFAACALHNSIRNHQVHRTSHFEFARSTQSAVWIEAC